jgi:hypothetical protein
MSKGLTFSDLLALFSNMIDDLNSVITWEGPIHIYLSFTSDPSLVNEPYIRDMQLRDSVGSEQARQQDYEGTNELIKKSGKMFATRLSPCSINPS